jgi:hypothetical protein
LQAVLQPLRKHLAMMFDHFAFDPASSIEYRASAPERRCL